MKKQSTDSKKNPDLHFWYLNSPLPCYISIRETCHQNTLCSSRGHLKTSKWQSINTPFNPLASPNLYFSKGNYCSTGFFVTIENGAAHSDDFCLHFSYVRENIRVKRIGPCKHPINLIYKGIQMLNNFNQINVRGERTIQRVFTCQFTIISLIVFDLKT